MVRQVHLVWSLWIYKFQNFKWNNNAYNIQRFFIISKSIITLETIPQMPRDRQKFKTWWIESPKLSVEINIYSSSVRQQTSHRWLAKSLNCRSQPRDRNPQINLCFKNRRINNKELSNTFRCRFRYKRAIPQINW